MKTRQGLGPSAEEAELRSAAAGLGPNAGHVRRMRIEPPAPAPEPGPVAGSRKPSAKRSDRPWGIRPFAPTGKPRGRWRPAELIAVLGLGLASLAGLVVGVVFVARRAKRREELPATPGPDPQRRADSVPPRT